MQIPELITKEWLYRLRACEGQTELFSKVFPKGMELNVPNLMKAHDAALQIRWLMLMVDYDCCQHYCRASTEDEYKSAFKHFITRLKRDKKLVKSPRKAA